MKESRRKYKYNDWRDWKFQERVGCSKKELNGNYKNEKYNMWNYKFTECD